MKAYQKLLLACAAMVLCACVLSPLVKPLADHWIPKSPKLTWKLDYDKDSRTYNFGKVFRRMLMVSAVLVFVLAGKALQLGSLAKLGLRRTAGWMRHLAAGTLIGVTSMAGFMALLWALRAATWRTPISLAEFSLDLLKYLIQAACIGVFEETLFRGVVLQTLLKDMRFLLAAGLSSALYSILHFFAADVPVTLGADPGVGFRALGICFAPMVTRPEIIPAFLGLFLLGVVLACAYRWTGSLYLPIALHASWVFALKGSGNLLHLGLGRPAWLYGTNQIVDGVPGCLFLLAVWLLLWVLYGRKTDPISSPD